MPKSSGVDLDAMLGEEMERHCSCFVSRLPQDVREWLDAKVAEARAANQRPNWAAYGRVVTRVTGMHTPHHSLDNHYQRGHL